MVTEILLKMIDKLVTKFMTPEDLVIMIVLFGLGILTTQLWPKYWNKQKVSEKDEEICPVTGEKLKCEQIPGIIKELKQIQKQIADAETRIYKIMNVLSKEYEGQWDRYLYDKDMSPKERLPGKR